MTGGALVMTSFWYAIVKTVFREPEEDVKMLKRKKSESKSRYLLSRHTVCYRGRMCLLFCVEL